MEFENNVDPGIGVSQEPQQTQEPQIQEPQTQEPQIQEPQNNNYEDRIREAVQQANTPYRGAYDLVNQIAANYGMTAEQYLQAVEQQKYQQQQEQYYQEQQQSEQYNNEIVDWVRQQRAQQQFEAQQKQQQEEWIAEVKELMGDYPELKPEDIPDEVYKDRVSKNIPLTYAYARYEKNLNRQAIEQNTINNLNKNSMATPGSLNNPGVDMKPNYNNMSSEDFNKLIERVKSGEFK